MTAASPGCPSADLVRTTGPRGALCQLLQKFFKGLLLGPLVLWLLFEEWGWEPLASCFAALGRLPVWRQLERHIVRLPPWAALLVFGAPVLALAPIKLLAVYLFSQGHFALGLGLLLSAKLAGTALVARLFQLTQPTLMQLAWFACAYTRWKAWKDRILRQARDSWPWRLGRLFKRRLKKQALRLQAAFKAAVARARQ